MNRLDALKVCVKAGVPFHVEDGEMIAFHHSDIERLVAVVEAIANPEEDLTWGQMERIRKARAYWLEEEP
jgi:hypothetical protein